jgi:hypothetical protein
MWKDCGYLSLTKDGKKLSVVIKKVRYFVSLTEVKELRLKRFWKVSVDIR